jgi:EpsI family protein
MMSAVADKLVDVLGPFALRPRAIAAFLLLVLGAAGAYLMTPRIHMADKRDYALHRLIPKSFDGWRQVKSDDLVLPDPQASQLADKIYNVVLARTYENARGEVIMLVIAYGGDQSDALQLHRPEVCYHAHGYQVSAPQYDRVTLDGLPLRITRVNTLDHYGAEPVSYWMRVGDRLVTTTFDREVQKVSYGLRGMIPDGVLVRVSNRTVAGTDMKPDYRLQDQFLADLLASISKPTRRLLVGDVRPAPLATASNE